MLQVSRLSQLQFILQVHQSEDRVTRHLTFSDLIKTKTQTKPFSFPYGVWLPSSFHSPRQELLFSSSHTWKFNLTIKHKNTKTSISFQKNQYHLLLIFRSWAFSQESTLDSPTSLLVELAFSLWSVETIDLVEAKRLGLLVGIKVSCALWPSSAGFRSHSKIVLCYYYEFLWKIYLYFSIITCIFHFLGWWRSSYSNRTCWSILFSSSDFCFWLLKLLSDLSFPICMC